MKVAMVGSGSLNKTIKTIASNSQGATTNLFKDVESGELVTEMPINKMFEVTSVLKDAEIKSGRENRRERRKQQRKNKL